MRSREGWNDAADFRRCVNEWAAKIGVQPRVVTLRPMKRKWGSCSTAGRLTFNNELLRESRKFGEYVIVEELLHLRVPNHGKLFRALLSAYLPNWQRTAARHSSHVTPRRACAAPFPFPT